jgi:hypothetical protein
LESIKRLDAHQRSRRPAALFGKRFFSKGRLAIGFF